MARKTLLEILRARVTFLHGQVFDFEDVHNNTIALDGAVQGPKMDPLRRRFSFDHKTDCIRMITLATCQQVSIALQLGLVVDDETKILVSELNSDVNVSVWLLLNAHRNQEPRIKELVERVGLTDAHGPAFPSHPLHPLIQLPSSSTEQQTLGHLVRWYNLITAYADGSYEPPPLKPQSNEGYGWMSNVGWRQFKNVQGYGPYFVRITYWPKPNGTYAYLLSKKSDLVLFPLGPSHHRRPAKTIDDYCGDTLLGLLAREELRINPNQSHEHNWGGGTSVGGSPRNPDGSGSRLHPNQILDLAQFITSK